MAYAKPHGIIDEEVLEASGVKGSLLSYKRKGETTLLLFCLIVEGLAKHLQYVGIDAAIPNGRSHNLGVVLLLISMDIVIVCDYVGVDRSIIQRKESTFDVRYNFMEAFVSDKESNVWGEES
ncbi:hypothetical protein Pint_05112 [Pistacia integerrima]|uniref:Uncharacterized protein n=1 Tax=Pistacia integerrima TaxID=434235 RepID=A0ACC0Z5E0_9ROSI|nr:hypothetical protein Pint_05112 [Pistacia integerrima]